MLALLKEGECLRAKKTEVFAIAFYSPFGNSIEGRIAPVMSLQHPVQTQQHEIRQKLISTKAQAFNTRVSHRVINDIAARLHGDFALLAKK